MWDHLKVLTYKANAKALLNGQMGSKRTFSLLPGEILDRKSAQVAYSIGQAHEYFKAADMVEINTSPLLYFYGMLSLAKALIVANHPSILLDDIKYHGLFTKPITLDLNNYVNEEAGWRIEKEYAITSEGVFKEFSELIHGFSLPKNSIVRFKNITSADPELSEMYQRYYRESPNVQYLYDLTVSGDPPFMEVCPSTKDQADFETRFPEITNYFDLQPGLKHNQALVYRSKTNLEELPCNIGTYYPFPGGQYLVSGMIYENNGTNFSKFITPELGDYMNMFILSNCVRYKQEFWGQVIDGSKTGSLAIVNLFISVARNRFPNFILNHLFKEKFEWGTATRLM
jgi:hypothetical protein